MANKLVRISKGLYRAEGSGTTISHFPFAIGEREETAKEKPWLVRWQNTFGWESRERFRTLADARASLRSVSTVNAK